MKEWITDALNKIRTAFDGLKPNSQAAKVLTETMDSLTEVERLFTEGVREAGERAKGAEAVTSTAGGVKLSSSQNNDYSYDAITNRDPIAFVEFTDNIPLENDGKTMNRKAIVDEARRNA